MSVRLLAFATPVLMLAPCQAQYLNRAIWLGTEDESIRRNFKQGTDYFLDRASYVDVMPWQRGATLDPFGNRFSLAGGSVSNTQLTIEGVGNGRVRLDETFGFGAHYLQSENQATQFQRFGMSLEALFSEQTAGFLLVEGSTQKERADLSFGVELARGTDHTQRITCTAVDFASHKSDSFDYEQRPFGLLFSGFGGSAESLEFAYELAAQLPMEERRFDDDERFRMHRTIGSFEVRIRCNQRDRLLLYGEGELSDKHVRPADPAASPREDYASKFGRARVEYWRAIGDGADWAVGGSYLYLDNDDDRPNDPQQNLRERRREALLSVRSRLVLSDKWTWEPYLLGGYIRHELDYDDPMVAPEDQGFEGFQGKWGAPIRYRFSAHASIRFDASVQLDQAKFAGGGIQFAAVF